MVLPQGCGQGGLTRWILTVGELRPPEVSAAEPVDTPAEGRDGSHVTAAPMALDPKPVRPPEPDAADCCGEGCIRCVYDRHDEALERYQAALAAWLERHR